MRQTIVLAQRLPFVFALLTLPQASRGERRAPTRAAATPLAEAPLWAATGDGVMRRAMNREFGVTYTVRDDPDHASPRPARDRGDVQGGDAVEAEADDAAIAARRSPSRASPELSGLTDRRDSGELTDAVHRLRPRGPPPSTSRPGQADPVFMQLVEQQAQLASVAARRTASVEPQ